MYKLQTNVYNLTQAKLYGLPEKKKKEDEHNVSPSVPTL